MDIELNGIKALKGKVILPGDKSISHRALLTASLSKGICKIQNLNRGQDVMATLDAVKKLGATVNQTKDSLELQGFSNPISAQINCQNSGTTMRLLCGILSGYEGHFVLKGDESLSKRPMDRVKKPLELMGAKINCNGNKSCVAPLEIFGRPLKGITYRLEIASAQVKSAILFAGLRAKGATTVIEDIPTRTHTEDILKKAGAKLEISQSNGSKNITVYPGEVNPFTIEIPCDPSQGAFWIVAGLINPETDLEIPLFYMDNTRSYFLEVLKRSGANFLIKEDKILPSFQNLSPLTVKANEVPLVIDEIPILAVAAAFIDGVSLFENVGELRVKETDRVLQICELVTAMGASGKTKDDNLYISGSKFLRPFEFDPKGDHRIAMAAIIAGCAIKGLSKIKSVECITISDTTFLKNLNELSK